MLTSENSKESLSKPYGVVTVGDLPFWRTSTPGSGHCDFVIYDVPKVRAALEVLMKLDGDPLVNAINLLVDVGEDHLNQQIVDKTRTMMAQAYGLLLLNEGQNRFVTISKTPPSRPRPGKRGPFAKSGDYVAAASLSLEDGLQEWPDLRFSGVPRVMRSAGLYWQVENGKPVGFLRGDKFMPLYNKVGEA